MRNDDDGISVFPVDVFNQFQNILGGIVIKGAGWLIAEQQIRILDDGTTDGCTLLLTAGKLAWNLILMLPKSKCMKQVIDIKRVASEVSADLDILLDGQVRNPSTLVTAYSAGAVLWALRRPSSARSA